MVKAKVEIYSRKVLNAYHIDAIHGALEEVIGNVLNANWDHQRAKFLLPPLMNLVSIRQGYLLGTNSVTPRFPKDPNPEEPNPKEPEVIRRTWNWRVCTVSMVGAVKKWQKSDAEKSLETWRKLSDANTRLETMLNLLSVIAKELWDSYYITVNRCSMLKCDKWLEQTSEPNQAEIVKTMLGARDAMLDIRQHIPLMGEAVVVPIEPQSQTQLLDTTMNMEGCCWQEFLEQVVLMLFLLSHLRELGHQCRRSLEFSECTGLASEGRSSWRLFGKQQSTDQGNYNQNFFSSYRVILQKANIKVQMWTFQALEKRLCNQLD